MHLENSISGSYSVVNVQTLYSFCRHLRLSKCYSLIASGYCGGVDEVLKDKDRQIDEMQKQLGDNRRQLDAKDAIIESLRKQLAEKS